MMILLFMFLSLVLGQEPLEQKIVGKSLEGTWQVTDQKSHIFRIPNQTMVYIPGHQSLQFLQQQSGDSKGDKKRNGEIEALFYYEPTETNRGDSTIYANYLFLRLYYPKYKSGKVVEFNIGLKGAFNSKSNSWKLQKTYTAVTLYEGLKAIGKLDIEITMKIRQQNQQIKIDIECESINLNISVNDSSYGIQYFIWFTVINIIQLIFIFFYFKMRDRNILYNTSEWLIVHGCCFIFTEAILYLIIAFSFFNTSLKYLLLNTVLNIVVILLLLRKFQAVIEKFKTIKNLFLCIAFVAVYVSLVYFFYDSLMFWVFESMIFLWQIYHSMKNGGTGGVSLDLILIIVLSRLPFWYLLGSGDNAQRLEPNYSAFYLILVFTLLHLILIGVQKKYGGRFMIPKLIIPGYYDFFRYANYEEEIVKNDCSICLIELRKKPEEQENPQPNLDDTNEDLRTVRITYALAPCKHAFHPKCLSDWLKEKLVCPNCRQELPPFNSNA